jgi:K(+)-stimulated pyrophosphate-energized sodium pump
VMGQLSLTGLIVALDAFGPITDNAGGIAEMADLPEEVRNVTDPLDAVGNTTKAVTKGYAIGSAVLAAVVLFAGFKDELASKGDHVTFLISSPPVLIGLILGGMMVCLFASLSIEAVGVAGGAVVEEVRRQFREKPGIMDGTDEPDYATCVDIVTRTAQREMILPSLLPIVLTVIVGLIDVQALGGLLIGVIVVGFFFAVLMTAGDQEHAQHDHHHREDPRHGVVRRAPRSLRRRSARRHRGYLINGMIRIATMLATLIMGLIAGPAVSLNGSPTVSPVTEAAWASEPLPP